MTEHVLSVARDAGELKADMRIVMHGVAEVQASPMYLQREVRPEFHLNHSTKPKSLRRRI